MQINRESLAWAAGLIEGEGWIYFQGKSPYIGVQMTDLEILTRLQAVLGCGNIHQRKLNPPNKKQQWTWRVSSFQLVQFVIVILWPWLGSRRRARAKEVLMIARSNPNKLRGPYKKSKKPNKFENPPEQEGNLEQVRDNPGDHHVCDVAVHSGTKSEE
jgi:hypothetical protein